MSRALIVVAKEPAIGLTKTRLASTLGPAQAAELSHGFLLDTLYLMGKVQDVQHVIAYTPPEAEAFFRQIAPPCFRLIPQKGEGLSERLDSVLRQHMALGYTRVIVMDSDSPTLPLAHLAQAFQALDSADVDATLGPCEDGGYYLVGLKAPCPMLFLGMQMSTSTVLAETLERARAQGLRVFLLPPWYDIDTFQDLHRLREDLSKMPDDIAPHTRRCLTSLAQLEHPSLLF